MYVFVVSWFLDLPPIDSQQGLATKYSYQVARIRRESFFQAGAAYGHEERPKSSERDPYRPLPFP